ncbi:mechanosensitive ion channel domain-containing protein [Amylibacter sp. IMCC11727]|mgnify:CR=1 FL=1|uniref:mechanosensitive ion channel family protein n=1 Tax=Amylibacter sp. IMCC11727 TaxID=3039851 RepID=UPI00244DEDC5|nr:mechanosensitive ion channel domain-containing protein [Amylibacter sp. IMCC11727]WGI21771.1 mechanosensitive ion channel [Amylibacter sp. IMCC11727]
MGWIGDLIFNVIYAGAILVAAVWAGGVLKKFIVSYSREYEDIDETLFTFLGSIARYALLVFAGIFILARFGIQTASLVAVIGAAGLAIGLALQGTLANLAAGVMLVIFRPFKIGDFVELDGFAGTVKSVNLFTTELATPDNVQIILPNGQVFGAAIKNYSFHDTRRVDLVFGVSYGSDLKLADKILSGLVASDDRILTDPASFVKVTNLGDSSVDFTVRVWVDADDYWDVKFDLTRQAKDAFDQGGIDIPFPTTTVVRADA